MLMEKYKMASKFYSSIAEFDECKWKSLHAMPGLLVNWKKIYNPTPKIFKATTPTPKIFKATTPTPKIFKANILIKTFKNLLYIYIILQIPLLLEVVFSRCPFQLLRSYERHEDNKRKIGPERSSMQQADYQCHRLSPWMQESVSMHKSPTQLRHSRMNQTRSEEEEKERKRDRKDRGQEADGKKCSPTKQKPF